MGQPIWKTVSASDYNRIEEDTTGEYSPEMDIAQEYEDEKGKTKFQVYRFPLDRLKLVEEGDKAYLVPLRWEKSWPHPLASYEEWFAEDLSSVARSIGSSEEELALAFTSEKTGERAWAYEAVGGYHGFDNFDSSPRTMTENQLNKYWTNR